MRMYLLAASVIAAAACGTDPQPSASLGGTWALSNPEVSATIVLRDTTYAGDLRDSMYRYDQEWELQGYATGTVSAVSHSQPWSGTCATMYYRAKEFSDPKKVSFQLRLQCQGSEVMTGDFGSSFRWNFYGTQSRDADWSQPITSTALTLGELLVPNQGTPPQRAATLTRTH